MPQNESVYADMEDSEQEVANYLTQLRIYWIYESPIFVYDERFDYQYREKIYRDNQIHVIYIHWFKDKDQWKNHFNKRLLDIDKYRHQTVTQMIKKLL